MIHQGLSQWSCHHLTPMHSSLGSTIVHAGAWTIERNFFLISNKQKVVHLPREYWKLQHMAPSTQILQMIWAKCITWQSNKKLMFLTYHMHFCLLNIGASKQITIFYSDMAPTWNNIQTFAPCFGVNKHFTKLFHWIET